MTTTTIRDGVVMLLLVLVKRSAAKTHIYYSIYISLLFYSHEVLETNVREREKRFRSVLSSAPSRCFFLPFFQMHENNEIFSSFPRKREKMYQREKGKRKKISSFFLTRTTSISSSHRRAHIQKIISLKKSASSLPNKQSFAVVVLFSLTVSLSQILS